MPNDQSCPLERIEELIQELHALVRCCPKQQQAEENLYNRVDDDED